MNNKKEVKPMGFAEAYYRSIMRKVVVAHELPNESFLPAFFFQDQIGEFSVVEDRNKVPMYLHPAQIARQNFMNEVYDWCMSYCGQHGFTPILTGHNDYLTTRERVDALMRGVIIESWDHAAMFKLTFECPTD